MCRARLTQSALELAPDGAGGVIAAWTDARWTTNVQIFGQHLTSAGVRAPGWTPNGDSLTVLPCYRTTLSMIPDGAGGVLIAWSENRCTYDRDIYAMRITASGAAWPGWTANGVPICLAINEQDSPVITGDGSDGAFIAWADRRSGIDNIYAQHVTGAGTIASGWPVDGLRVCAVASTQLAPVIAPDGAGGAFIAWQDDRADYDIYLQRLTADGSLSPGWIASGVAVCAAPGDQRAPAMVSDGAGGVYLTWTDHRSGTDDDVYAHRFSGSGAPAPGWTTFGVPIVTLGGDQQAPALATDGGSGALLAWQDHRGGDFDIYAQRIDSNGNPGSGWPANGAVVCAAAGDQVAPQVVPDAVGGALLVWQDARAGGPHIYGQHLDASGGRFSGWPVDGVALCAADGVQQAPRLISDDAGGAIAGWTDSRPCDTTGVDVYATRVLPSGIEPAQVKDLSARSHDGQTFLTWTCPTGDGWTYFVYASTSPITSATNLGAVTLLGTVRDSSWYDRRLSVLRGMPYAYSVDSLVPLSPSQGLFVTVDVADQATYYAVTAQLADCGENCCVTPGVNALALPVTEHVGTPVPVYQRTLTPSPGARPADVYTLWTSDLETPVFPAMANRPSLPFDCAVTHGGLPPLNSLMLSMHARGADFLQAVVSTSGYPGEWVLGLDDPVSTTDLDTFWYGYHEDYDVTRWQNPVPTSGTVRDYTMRRVLHTLLWARRHFLVDTTRVYAYGFSMAGIGSVLLSLRRPDLIAGVLAITPKFDFSFVSDPNPENLFNPGGWLRSVADRLWGSVATDLPSSEGRPIFNELNDGYMLGVNPGLSVPPIIAFNGKNDTTVGWAEKIPTFHAWHDARQGAYFYWDPRDHLNNSTSAWVPMQDPQYLYRFRTDRSFPALTDCSLNDDPGNGGAASGDSVGCINGYVEWDTVLVDQAGEWQTTLWTRGLETRWWDLPAPESLTVSVTPRRLQSFVVPAGATVGFDVVRRNDGATVEAGSVVADASGLATIPAVKVYHAGSVLQLRVTSAGVSPDAHAPPVRLEIHVGRNPIRAACPVTVAWPGSARARVALVDVSGRQVRALFEGSVKPGIATLELEPSRLPDGVYFLEARQLGKTQVVRVVVLR